MCLGGIMVSFMLVNGEQLNLMLTFMNFFVIEMYKESINPLILLLLIPQAEYRAKARLRVKAHSDSARFEGCKAHISTIMLLLKSQNIKKSHPFPTPTPNMRGYCACSSVTFVEHRWNDSSEPG